MGGDDREGGYSGLGRAVIDLARVPVETGGRTRADHPALVLLPGFGSLPPVHGGPACGCERTLEMHARHRIPVAVGHIDQHAVSQDPGVVDEGVDGAERLHRMGDQASRAVPIRGVVAVGHRLPAECPDLLDHFVRRTTRAAFSVHRHPEVVHHDLGTLSGEFEGVAPSHAPARAGDDHNPPLTDSAHCPSSIRTSTVCRSDPTLADIRFFLASIHRAAT